MQLISVDNIIELLIYEPLSRKLESKSCASYVVDDCIVSDVIVKLFTYCLPHL